MSERVIVRAVSASIIVLALSTTLFGCSGKRVAASAGDAASTTKENSAAAPVETISPESMITVPDDRSATQETARPLVDPAPAPPAESTPSVPPALLTETPPASNPPAAPPAPADEIVSLADVFFDFDQYTIRRDAHSVLSANAAWINSRPGKAVVIEGHCDERGTQAYNLVLGDKRARSTKRYLEELGVATSRLKTTSYGEIRPFCKERDEHCYQQNRRAHFVVQ
jgi:peptidoglycan-associated lipoprotein